MKRLIFAQKALSEIPKILTLLDRNAHSPTYGCFDRNFWHYKIIDFPSGMSQEFVWPVALAYETDIPGNPFYKKTVLREWVHAGISYAAKSAHKDASCDDYFPYEKASGAAAFSLLAFIESYKIFKFEDDKLINFFIKRADWLANHQESGRLSNHQALIVLCLDLLGRLLNTDRWIAQKNERLEKVLSWQNEEGWFQEYEGCDPGYHSLTVLLLAWIHDLNRSNLKLQNALSLGIDFCAEFIHPDGTYGGEYGSRNTNNFFTYGFELAGRWKPEALSINDLFSQALTNNLTPCYSDDHILGHHAWNYFLTWRDYVSDRPATRSRNPNRVWFKNAGLLIDRRDNFEIYVALNKGGVFKLFYKNRLLCSDTNFSIVVSEGRKQKNAVAHLIDNYDVSIEDHIVRISGQMGWAKHQQMNSIKLIILRVIMLGGGRLFPDIIRKMLQFMLITGKSKADYRFERTFSWEKEKLEVSDRLEAKDWKSVRQVGIGCDQTSIYVVMSRTFHNGQLQSFIHLNEDLQKLKSGEALVYKRNFL